MSSSFETFKAADLLQYCNIFVIALAVSKVQKDKKSPTFQILF